MIRILIFLLILPYLALAEDTPNNLRIEQLVFLGNKNVDEKTLRRLARLRAGDNADAEEIKAANTRIITGYLEQGFMSVAVTSNLEQDPELPLVDLIFTINEGYRSKLRDVELRGELPPDVANLKQEFLDLANGQFASKEILRELNRQLLTALRNEGYLSAIIEEAELQYLPDSEDTRAVFFVETGDPLSIVFSGNSKFSAKDLLGLLQLENRTTPFRHRAIPNLGKKIQRFYQEQGYYFAEVVHRELPAVGKRRQFEIRINEGVRTTLEDINFLGNSNIKKKDLLSVMTCKPAGPRLLRRWLPGYLTTNQLEEDLLAIRDYYRQEGYLDVDVSYALTEVNNNPNQLTLEVKVVENERFLFKDVGILWNNDEGYSLISDPALLGVTTSLKKNDPFSSNSISLARKELESSISSLGYPNAEIREVFNTNDAEFYFSVTPNEKINVGKVQLSGNVFTDDHVILRELDFAGDAPWNKEKIARTTRALYGLGFFRRVAIGPADGYLDSEVEDLRVEVVERETGSYNLGLGFDTEDGLHILGNITQRNFQGKGNALSVSLDGYFKSGARVLDAGRLRTSFTKPRLLDSDVQLFAEAFFQSSIKLLDTFSYDKEGVTVVLRTPFSDSLNGRLGLSLFRQNLFDVPDDIVIGPYDRGTSFVSLLSTELILDERDDSFNPRSGFKSSIGAKVASEYIGSDASFYSLNLKHAHYFPLASKLVWANSVRGQYQQPISETSVLPLGQRIFLGGRNSLRGFSPHAVGPRGEAGNIVGGDTSLLFNTEFLLSITEDLLGLVFLDVGQAILKSKGSFEENPLHLIADLRYSPGIGIRYRTPIGPLGIEYGVALDRENGERFGRLNLNIGGAF